MLGRHFGIARIVDCQYRLGVDKLHQLEQLFGTLARHVIHQQRCLGKVDQHAPLVSHPAQAHALCGGIALDGVILRVELLDEWCDAVETHGSLLLERVDTEDGDLVLVEDGTVGAQCRVAPVVGPLDEVHPDGHKKSRGSLLALEVDSAREALGEELAEVLAVLRSLFGDFSAQLLGSPLHNRGSDGLLEGDVVVLALGGHRHLVDIILRYRTLGGIVLGRTVVRSHIDAEAELHLAVPLQRMRQVEPLEQRLRPMIKNLHSAILRVVSRLARIGYQIVAVPRHDEASATI